MIAAYMLSIGFAAALVNVLIAISALIWQLRREPRIERGASILRIFMITLGVALIAYPNVSKSAPPELVLVGGGVFLVFLAAPQLSVWCVRLIQRRQNN
jgi:cytochrome bd-type quinol oxidase subunit 2